MQWDYIGDKQQSTSSLFGGGGSFKTDGYDPAQLAWDVGITLSIMPDDDITISLDYDYELKEDFDGHTGFGVIKYTI